jgi:hypothetical protein
MTDRDPEPAGRYCLSTHALHELQSVTGKQQLLTPAGFARWPGVSVIAAARNQIIRLCVCCIVAPAWRARGLVWRRRERGSGEAGQARGTLRLPGPA